MMANKEGIYRLNDEIIHNILARLPALSFAAATCVNKTWYHVSTQILSRPKLVSALSLNPYLIDVVDEVLNKILCDPIRPDFAIACISDDFSLKLAHQLLTRKLGAKTPLVTHISNGVMGMDALTDELKEVQWEYFNYRNHHPHEYNAPYNANKGMLLVIGCLPGLKVDVIPLFHPNRMGLRTTMADITTFINEIKNYTATISVEEFPSAIMTFGDFNCDVNYLIAKMDHAMPKETAIVGNGGGCFMFNSLNYAITSPPHTYVLDDVVLVFAKDKNKSPGETKFHVVMAGGLLAFESLLEVIVVEIKFATKSSWIYAKTKEGDGILSLEDLKERIKVAYDDDLSPDLYIGVMQKRRYNSGRSLNSETSVAFYHVIGGEGPYIIVDGTGIMLGDSFKFYYRDLETASATSDNAYMYMKTLKENTGGKTNDCGVFGGLIFSCHSRGESYFGHPNYDTFPFSLSTFLVSQLLECSAKEKLGVAFHVLLRKMRIKSNALIIVVTMLVVRFISSCLIIILYLSQALNHSK